MSKALKGDILLFIIFVIFAISTIIGVSYLISDIRHKRRCNESIEMLVPAAIGTTILLFAHWYCS